MNRGMAKIGDIVPDLGFPQPVAKENRPPHPKPPRVVGDPTRTPVNRQAAMIATRAHPLHMPPMPTEPPKKSELESLREEVAILRATNTQLKHENNALRRKINRPRCPERKTPSTAPVEPEPKESARSDRRLAILERLQNGH